MKLLNLSVLALTAVSVFGCSQRPLVLLETQAPQRKVVAAQHLHTLADRVVDRLVCSAGDTVSLEEGACRTDKPIYIKAASPDMPFSEAFDVYLTKSLVERGVRVSKSPVGADILKFHVQSFLYAPTGERHPFDKTTFWTTLGALIGFGAEGNPTTGVKLAGLAFAGPAFDFFIGMGETTNAEVVLTAVLEKQATISKLYVEEFYVAPREVAPSGMYWTNFPADPFDQQPLQLGPPPRARTIRVASD